MCIIKKWFPLRRREKPLFYVIHLNNNHADILIFLFGLHFGNVPVIREENDEVSTVDFEEIGLLLVIGIAHYILLFVIRHGNCA